MSEELDNSVVIPLLLRKYSDYFSPEDRKNIDNEDIQYELFETLLYEKGKTVCYVEWNTNNPGAGSGVTWIKKIDDLFYLFIDADIELQGPYASFDEILEEALRCRYIDDSLKVVHIDKNIEDIDWVIEADDGYELRINSEDYVVRDGKLKKVSHK